MEEWGGIFQTMFTGKDIFVKRVFFVSVLHRVYESRQGLFKRKVFFLTMSVTRDVSQDALIDIQIKRIHEYKRSDLRENRAMTWGSKPMKNTIFWGMNIQKSQLFWCENQGTRVLTHRHMVRNKFLFTFFCWTPKKQRALSRPMTWWVT